MSVDIGRQLHGYCQMIDQIQGPISVGDVLERSGELQVIPGRSRQAQPRRKWLTAAIAALVALVIVVGLRFLPTGNPGPADQPSTTTIPARTTAVGNGWIAFSTQPGGTQVMETDRDRGGDIYIVRPDAEARKIVDRGEDNITNVCPIFSPDGSKLAYGERAGIDRALAVLEIGASGAVNELSRIDLGPGQIAPCPRWSADGERLAFLTDEPAGQRRIVVMGLNGSTLKAGDSDPTVTELTTTMPTSVPLAEVRSVASPDGSSVATLQGSLITLANSNGPQPREIPIGCCFYGLAAWSPDGRYILVMRDAGLSAQILAVSVEPPYESKTIVNGVAVNGARSWPGFGDVSWQAIRSNS